MSSVRMMLHPPKIKMHRSLGLKQAVWPQRERSSNDDGDNGDLDDEVGVIGVEEEGDGDGGGDVNFELLFVVFVVVVVVAAPLLSFDVTWFCGEGVTI